MKFLYNIGISVISVVIGIGSLFSEKLRLLRRGRAEVWDKLKTAGINEPVIWVHAASLGEFEQGRPLIEAVKKHFPEKKIVLTFFSPSGYEVRKNYDLADYVLYLPSDTKANARNFIDAVNPEKVFFVKYEFWYNFLNELNKRSIPVYGVSMIFREEQSFFKWYGGWFRKVLGFFDHFYLQDDKSAELLSGLGLKNYTVAGDTRFDRVKEIAGSASEIDIAKRFSDGYRTIIAGSSWPPDEKILAEYINNSPDDVKMIIAPHVIDESHIKQIESLLKVSHFRITSPPEEVGGFKVMIVNTIGMLSAIYRYGDIGYVGGGFGTGIHNTLEAAVYGIPVLFGPNYKKFKEACDLIEKGGGFEITKSGDFNTLVNRMWEEPDFLRKSGEAAGKYVESMCGATAVIMKDVFSVNV